VDVKNVETPVLELFALAVYISILALSIETIQQTTCRYWYQLNPFAHRVKAKLQTSKLAKQQFAQTLKMWNG